MAQSQAESTWEMNNYGRYINQFPPNIINSIRQYERINKKICRQKISITFNEICIYIYIYIFFTEHVTIEFSLIFIQKRISSLIYHLLYSFSKLFAVSMQSMFFLFLSKPNSADQFKSDYSSPTVTMKKCTALFKPSD